MQKRLRKNKSSHLSILVSEPVDVATGHSTANVRQKGCDVGLKAALRYIRSHILQMMGIQENQLDYYQSTSLLPKMVSFFNSQVLGCTRGTEGEQEGAVCDEIS